MGIFDIPGVPNTPAGRTALARSDEFKADFVPIPKPDDIRQNALTGMVHVPAIPSTQDGGAFIQAYNNAMEAGNKNTAPLGTGLLFLGEKYFCTTRIKNLIKAFDWRSANRAKFTTLQNRIGYGGTQIICAIPDNSIGDNTEPFIDIGSRLPDVSFFSGVTWSDISIVGRELSSDTTPNKSQFPVIDPIRFRRFGWDCKVDSLWVRRFVGSVVFDQCYDSAWNDMTVTGLGGLINGVPRYALSFMSEDSTDVCNAMKFKSLHVEACRYVISGTAMRHVEFFGGSKVEINDYFSPIAFDTDLVNPAFYFAASVMEILWTGGYIIGAHVGKWLSVAGNAGKTADDLPPVIVCDADRTENNSVLIFNGTFFTNGRETEPTYKRGVKWIRGRNIKLANVFMDYVTTETTSLDLTKSEIIGGTFVLGTYGHQQGGTAKPIVLNADAAARDIVLRVSGGTALYAVVLNGARSTASLAIPPASVSRPVIGGGSSGGGYRGSPGMETLDATTYSTKYGTAINYTAASIDPTLHVNDIISLTFGSNALTINTIVVSQNPRGRTISLYNAGTADITIAATTSQDGSTITAGSVKTYRLVANKWFLG